MIVENVKAITVVSPLSIQYNTIFDKIQDFLSTTKRPISQPPCFVISKSSTSKTHFFAQSVNSSLKKTSSIRLTLPIFVTSKHFADDWHNEARQRLNLFYKYNSPLPRGNRQGDIIVWERFYNRLCRICCCPATGTPVSNSMVELYRRTMIGPTQLVRSFQKRS